jgi:ribonuclease G
MSKELVISSNRHETKVAILEDDQLVEIYFQRANEYSLAGSIHKGRVTRVLPGMQSAFVDLGLERDTFLYVSDFFEENGEEYDRLGDVTRRDGSRAPQGPPPAPQARPPVIIADAPVTSAAPVAPTAPVQPGSERPFGDRPRDQDRDRDGRGRRSRRRRRDNRGEGRGIPESKYASAPRETPVPAAETATDEAARPSEEPAVQTREITLLPGESLAKYSRPAEDDESSKPVEELDTVAPVSEAEVHASTVTEQEPETIEVDEIEEEEDDEEALELGSAEAAREEVIAPGYAQEHAAPMSAAASAAVALEPSPAEEAVSAEDLTEEAFDLAEAEVDESDDLDEADLIQEAAEEALAEEAAAAATGEAPPVVAAEAATAEAAALEKPLAAGVRDQGTRFMHRGPRGARRRRGRGRGGEDRGELRPEGETENRPEIRTESRAENRGENRSEHRGENRGENRGDMRQVIRPAMRSITDLLKEGQEIIVQIAKEPIAQKGARITSHIALPGRYVVFMPSLDHLGVSRKIESDEERHRLKRILQAQHQGIPGGFIVRTAGAGKSEEDIGADMHFLYNLWLDIRTKAEKKPAPLLLHHDLEVVERILRDQLTDSFKAVWCDTEEMFEEVLRFMQRFQPALVNRVKMYTRPAPIFDAFNITAELEKALRPKVWLKSGGYIVINQTEALVAIDINTGKFVGKSNRLEDTIVKTNIEAVKEVVRQIRLRDLGGIIVVDFIDMDERKNRQKVMQALEECMRADRAPNKILQFNDFGLVAITRKRVKQSLERTLCQPCPTCEGAGYVKSVQTVVGEIVQEAQKLRPAVQDQKDVMLRANPEVTKFLKSSKNSYLEEIEEILGRPVLVTSDPELHPEKFDLT